MRIAFIGQSAFGEAVLKALAGNDDDEIVGVFLSKGRGGKEDPVATTAKALSLPVYECARFRDPESIDQFVALDSELCVMAYVIDIVPMEMINAPAKGTIQYHPSLLPLHRGPSSINWPIVNGETQTGLSIFWPDDGLDTGPLLIQKTVAIEADDTLGSLYFQKLFPMGVDAMVEAVELVRQGEAPKVVQNEDDATYEGWFKAKEARIDWSRPGAEIYNLIRGSDPQPGANSTLDGETVSFYAASYSPGESSEPGGTVLAVGEHIAIAVADGTISVGRVRGADGKVSAADFVAATGVAPGARFGG